MKMNVRDVELGIVLAQDWTRRSRGFVPRRRRRRKTNPEWAKLRRLYDKDGTYDRILREQGGTCAICGQLPKEGGRRLHLDHNHKTLQVRGILCFRCNAALRGYVTVEWLEGALRYMKTHTSPSSTD